LTKTPTTDGTEIPPEAPSKALRAWLAALSFMAPVVACGSVIMGWLVLMDTQIEMNPHGDPLVRQDALGFRIFAWGGINLVILLLAAGTFGGWSAYRHGRGRRSFGLSLLATVPILLIAAGILSVYLAKKP
jgi:hypothetical protein